MDEPTEIIGIDPGFGKPAVAALSPRSGKVKRVSAFDGKAPTSLDMSLRAHAIGLLIARYVGEVEGTKIVGIEGPAYGVKRSRSIEQLARCRQAIFSVLTFTLPDLLIYEIPPASAKMAVTGQGNASKDQVLKCIERSFRVNLSMTHETRCAQADAIAIAVCTYNRWKRGFQ